MTVYDEPPERRRGDHAAWWTVLTATAALIVLIAGVILVIGSGGSGAAPLPPGPAVTALPSSTATTSSTPTPWSTTPSSTTVSETSTTAAASSTRPEHPTTSHQATKTQSSTTPATPSTHRASPTPGPAPTVAPERHEQHPAPKSMGASEIRIPVQRVDAPIVGACRIHDGQMDPPSDVHQTCAWQRDQVTVITGHVNYVGQGTGALGNIAYLHAGDHVYTNLNGHRTGWAVRDVTAYSKAALPPSVFLSAVDGGPTLRLVTCGGKLNRSTGHYVDSVVVTLTPAEG